MRVQYWNISTAVKTMVEGWTWKTRNNFFGSWWLNWERIIYGKLYGEREKKNFLLWYLLGWKRWKLRQRWRVDIDNETTCRDELNMLNTTYYYGFWSVFSVRKLENSCSETVNRFAHRFSMPQWTHTLKKCWTGEKVEAYNFASNDEWVGWQWV